MEFMMQATSGEYGEINAAVLTTTGTYLDTLLRRVHKARKMKRKDPTFIESAYSDTNIEFGRVLTEEAESKYCDGQQGPLLVEEKIDSVFEAQWTACDRVLVDADGVRFQCEEKHTEIVAGTIYIPVFQLVAMLIKVDDTLEGDMDEKIHDLMAAEAAVINSQGIASQLEEYLDLPAWMVEKYLDNEWIEDSE